MANIHITEENSTMYKSLLVTAAIIGGQDKTISKKKVHIIDEKILYENIEMLVKARGKEFGLVEDDARYYAEILPHMPIMDELLREGSLKQIKLGKNNELYYIVTNSALSGKDNYSNTWL